MLVNIKRKIASSLSLCAKVSRKEAATSLQVGGKLGDISSTIAFSLAKKKKKNPAEIAKEIAGKTGQMQYIQKTESAGPYVNFYFSDSFWQEFSKSVNGDYGRGLKKRGKVLIESPSVNPNKPWHIGHLRNALLGDSLTRLLRFAGYNAELEDYIDDLGLQVAQSVWGLANLPKPSESKFDHLLGKQYVEVSKLAKNEETMQQIRALLKELESGRGVVPKNARAIVERCVAAQYQTAFSYGIYHDVLIFESDIMREIFAEGMELLKSSGAAKLETAGKNAGCWVVKLEGAKGFEGMESADKVLIRSDGTATYTGKDVVFQLWKFGKLKGKLRYLPFIKQPNGTTAYMSAKLGPKMKFGYAEKVINVIGMEQAYPQKVLKTVLEMLGFARESENSIHLSYEHATLPDASFSGRKGTWIGKQGSLGYTADELLQEAKKRAMEKIRGEFSDVERQAIANAVAIGAVRFSFLRTSSDKKIVFDWDKSLSLEGDSGPYIQYAYTRACSILGKAKGIKEGKKEEAQYEFSAPEKALLAHILKFPEAVQSCSSSIQIHPIADYALDLAGLFSKFYATTHVLSDKVDAHSRGIRLAQVNAFKNTMSASMQILGIPAIERM